MDGDVDGDINVHGFCSRDSGRRVEIGAPAAGDTVRHGPTERNDARTWSKWVVYVPVPGWRGSLPG
jgi:hypothetical protein